jgi:hypothetical protein
MQTHIDASAHFSAFERSLRLLWTPRFGTYYVATLLSNIGTWSQQIAEPWLLLSLGASSFLIGLDAFVQAAPAWMLILAGGALADRADRRIVITAFQAIQMMCPIILVTLLLTKTVEPWMVVVLSLVVGVTDAISMPSFQTIAPSIVRHDQIPTAIALNATQFNLSRILGPALAGVLMACVGAIGCFVANAASYVPFIAVVLWILPRGSTPAPADQKLDRHHLFAGLRKILASPHMRGALLTVLTTSMLCGPLIIFLPGPCEGCSARRCEPVQPFDRRVRRWRFVWRRRAARCGPCQRYPKAKFGLCRYLRHHHRIGGGGGGLSVGSLLAGVSANLLGVRYALLINGVLAVVAHFIVGRRWSRCRLPPTAPTLTSH